MIYIYIYIKYNMYALYIYVYLRLFLHICVLYIYIYIRVRVDLQMMYVPHLPRPTCEYLRSDRPFAQVSALNVPGLRCSKAQLGCAWGPQSSAELEMLQKASWHPGFHIMWVKQCHKPHIWEWFIPLLYLWWFEGLFIIVLPSLNALIE